MAWTEITRSQYNRRALRYASDCTDGEWQLIEPFLVRNGGVGRPRKTDMRAFWDAIQYIAPVYYRDGLPMGHVAQRVSTVHDGAVLFLSNARHWRIRSDQRSSDLRGAGDRWPR